MKFANLARSFEQYRNQNPVTDAQSASFLKMAGFFRRPDSDGQSADDELYTQALMEIADACEQVFLLQHAGGPDFFLIGAIYHHQPSERDDVESVFAGGRGLTLRDAFVGCMEELSERLATRRWKPRPAAEDVTHICELAPQWWSNQMINDLGNQSVLIEGCRLADNQIVGFPWSGRNAYFGHSHGCAAARTIATARKRAALELAERHAVAKWWYEKSVAMAPSSDCFVQLARIFVPGTDLKRHRWLLDLTCANEIPFIAALSCDHAGGGLIAGFAADCDRNQAALRASMELCQMEAAASLAVRKLSEMGVEALSPSDQLWIERVTSEPVLHARPSNSEMRSSTVSIDDGGLFDRLGPTYQFNMTDERSPVVSVRLVATDLLTMASPQNGLLHRTDKTLASEFPTFEAYPPPL